MNPQSTYNSFIFNEELDSNFLFSMYEDDFAYIEEVFSITLAQLDPDLEQVRQAHAAGDLSALRKAVHKVKPSFGFVGLIATQEACRAFEDLCDQAGSFGSVSQPFHELQEKLSRGRTIISQELDKLKKFNAQL